MGKRKKPGALKFAASSKLGHFKGASAASSKPASLPVTTECSSAGDVHGEQPSSNHVGELDSLGESQSLKNVTSCTVEGSSSSAETIPDPPFEYLSMTEGHVVVSPLSGNAEPSLFARIQKSSMLQELGTPTTHVSGAPFVMIPDENIDSAKEEFKEFVFARFPGEVPPMGRIIGVVNAIWARAGPIIFVHKIGEGTFLLKVTNERTRDALLSRQVWMIKGCPMFVAAWSPEFTPEQPQLTSAVVPVELRGVPYLLFNNQSLIAKVWVKVNLLAALPDRIVSGFSNGREVEISVSYPWLPDKCSSCKKFGHKHQLCPVVGHEWRPTVPPATHRNVSSAARSLSRESKEPASPQRDPPSEAQESLGTGTSESMMAQKDSLDDLQLVVNAELEEPSEGNASDKTCLKEGPPKQVVSLDMNLGFSTVHVYHVDDGTASDSDRAASNDPFFLVSNWKGSRKATKA
ncbi:hypothetical protein DY000_02015527 [Brassica cretica]|uniref:DUF4283 domain-containing protein n=1 Tax=Brassica cretica TaxID=69181 RepID=A0ABQ7CTI0_BRACR|nr:hypothetical protein DY000_02015527 [Brassica cretica]